MVKEAELKRLENKFKLSFLQTEKRLVELEVALSDLQEKLKDVDIESINEIKQKVEDLEDLIMVEQAGIIELKKILEEFGEKIKKPTKIPEIEKEIAEIKEFNLKLKENIEKKISELSSIRKEIESKISQIENKMKAALNYEPVLEEIKKLKNDFLSISAKMSITEEFISKVMSEVGELKPKVSKILETDFENIRREIERKISEFKSIEERLKKIQETTDVFDEIKKVKSEFLVINAKISGMDEFIKNFVKEVNKIKPLINKIESFENILKSSEKLEQKLMEIKLRSDEIERMQKRLEEIHSATSEKFYKIDLLDSRVSLLEDMKKNLALLEEKIGNLRKEIEVSNATINQLIIDFQNKIEATRRDIEKVVKKEEIDNIFKEIEERFKEIEKKNKTKLEEIASIVERRVIETKAPIGALNAQIDELINRVINLESKIIAIERAIQESKKKQPIILE